MQSVDVSPLREWFPQWLDSLKEGSHHYGLDDICRKYIPTLEKLWASGEVKRRLKKRYDACHEKNASKAEQQIKRFLADACVNWRHGSERTAEPPSVRRRTLLRLAKKARSLSNAMGRGTMEALIPSGLERTIFLKDRRFHPSCIFPYIKMQHEDDALPWSFNHDGIDYDELNFDFSSRQSLSHTIRHFAGALDNQVSWLDSQPTHRFAKLNTYAHRLSWHCFDTFGSVDRPLVAAVVRIVSGSQISLSMVPKHRK